MADRVAAAPASPGAPRERTLSLEHAEDAGRGPDRVELLAPAGGMEAGLAAFQYGADAVYLG